MTRKRFQISATKVLLCVSDENLDRQKMADLFVEMQQSVIPDINLIANNTNREACVATDIRFKNCQFSADAWLDFALTGLQALKRIELMDSTFSFGQMHQLLIDRIKSKRKIAIEVMITEHFKPDYRMRNLAFFNHWLELWREHWWLEVSSVVNPDIYNLVREYQSWVDQAVLMQLDFHASMLFYSELGLHIFEHPLWLQWQDVLQKLITQIKSAIHSVPNGQEFRELVAFIQDFACELEIFNPKIRDSKIKETSLCNYFILFSNYRMLRFRTMECIFNNDLQLLFKEINYFIEFYKGAREFAPEFESTALQTIRLASVAFFYQVVVLVSKCTDMQSREMLNKLISQDEMKEFFTVLKQCDITRWGSAFAYDLGMGLFSVFEKMKQNYLLCQCKDSIRFSESALEALEQIIQKSGNSTVSKLLLSIVMKNHHGVQVETENVELLDYLITLDQKLLSLFTRAGLVATRPMVASLFSGCRFEQVAMVENYYSVLSFIIISIRLRADVAYKMASPPQARQYMSDRYLQKNPMDLSHVESQDIKPIHCGRKIVRIYSLNQIWSTRISILERRRVFFQLIDTMNRVGQDVDNYLLQLGFAIEKRRHLSAAPLLFDLHTPIGGLNLATQEAHQSNAVLQRIDVVRLLQPLLQECRLPTMSQTNQALKSEVQANSVILHAAVDNATFLLRSENKKCVVKLLEVEWDKYHKIFTTVLQTATEKIALMEAKLKKHAEAVLAYENKVWQQITTFRPEPQRHFFKSKRRMPTIKTAGTKTKPTAQLQPGPNDSDEIDSFEPDYLRTYPILKTINNLMNQSKFQAVINLAKKELDKLVSEDSSYPLMACLCYILADCLRMIEGMQFGTQSVKQFSQTAYEYLVQGHHYVQVTRTLGLSFDADLLQIFAFLEQELESCPHYNEMELQAQDFLSEKRLAEFIKSLLQHFPQDILYIYGSAATAALYRLLHPKDTPLRVGDIDMVAFVPDWQAACKIMSTHFQNFRKSSRAGLFRGNYQGLELDFLLLDGQREDPRSFVAKLNLTCKGVLVKLDGTILDLSELATPHILRKEAHLMPTLSLSDNPLAILNSLETQARYAFSGSPQDKQRIIANMDVLATVKPFLLREHVFRHFQRGFAKKAWELWNEYHIFAILLPAVFATRALVQAHYLALCDDFDEHFRKNNRPQWCTPLGLLSQFLKIVIDNAVLNNTVAEKIQVAQTIVFKSDAVLLKELSIFEKYNICRLAGYTLFDPKNVSPNEALSLTEESIQGIKNK